MVEETVCFTVVYETETRSQLTEWESMLDEAVKRDAFLSGIQLDDRGLT